MWERGQDSTTYISGNMGIGNPQAQTTSRTLRAPGSGKREGRNGEGAGE